jgi:hypothetical protein
MTVYVLPIKHSYVSSWGIWEAVREAVQNGLDEQEENGNELIVSHKNNQLSVRNIGANLNAKALLIGHSTKSELDLRGQHGEGLNLGMLAAVRAGRKMRIETPWEVWTPSISYSVEYGERVLQVNTRNRRKEGDGVEVTIDITEQEWEEYKRNFLPLTELPDDSFVRTQSGTILFDPAFKGRIYAKGIFVTIDLGLRYGYDLKNVRLDRDRRLVDAFNKRWEIGQMFSEAAAKSPQKIGKIVFELLQNDWEDAKGLGQYSGSTLKEVVSEQFVEEFGDTAVPVQSIGDSAEIEHFGRRGIVANNNLRDLLVNTKVQNVIQVKAAFSNAVKKAYSHGELTDLEKLNLEKLEVLFGTLKEFIPSLPVDIQDLSDQLGVGVHTLTGIPSRILDAVEIADFFDSKTQGLCDMVTGKITLSKSLLSNFNHTLKVYIHELSHRIAGSSDGYKDHVDSMQDLWVIVYNFKLLK